MKFPRHLYRHGGVFRARASDNSYTAPSSAVPAHAPRKLAIVGTVGIPAAYGGFETLVENLAAYHRDHNLRSRVVVYCSSKSYKLKPRIHFGAELRYVPLPANGAASVLYDIVCLVSAVWRRADVCLLLGVSGAIALPALRIVSKARFVTNIDGIEWKRAKWRGFSKWFLKFSEFLAIRYSHEVIADNGAIAQYVSETYGRACHVISYGGDHAVSIDPAPCSDVALPPRYALALCRIEPENNVAMVLEAFGGIPEIPLIFIGNWNNSTFGRNLRQRYAGVRHIQLLDPIYATDILRLIRGGAFAYIHGHSAGGTNPSLVEMMHFGVPVLAYDCKFNRFTTDGAAIFFKSAEMLRSAMVGLTREDAEIVGAAMLQIANARYTWSAIGREYFNLLQTDGVLPIQRLRSRPAQELQT